MGDKVLATDPIGKVTEGKQVDATLVTPDDRNFTTITVAGSAGPEKLTATDHHPLWSPSEGAWLDAGDVKAGMTLLSADGEALKTVGVRHFSQEQAAYNLTVRGLHTYYVVAGGTAVLVHNIGGCPPLREIHTDRSFSKSSLEFWRKQDTEDIVFSLRPGADEALRVTSDGTVMNGNTRVSILRTRGYDVDSLPREPYGGKPTTDEEFWNMDQ